MKKLLQKLGKIPVFLAVVFVAYIAEDTGQDIYTDFLDNTFRKGIVTLVNIGLPKMVDSETSLDSVIWINKRIKYKHTMINWLESEVDVPAFKQRMLPKLRKYYCTNEEMSIFLSSDIPVIYAYHDKEGEQFAMITIKPTGCASS